MKRRTTIFWGIVIFQTAVILTMVALKQSVILYGTTIILKTRPVDPYSLFQGDYARLSYPISSVSLSWTPHKGETVYTQLQRPTTSWELSAVYQKLPATAPNRVVLKGVVESFFPKRGHVVFNLVDVSSPGWLQTQSETAPWRFGWGVGGRVSALWFPNKSQEGKKVFIQLGSVDNQNWYMMQVQESTRTLLSPYAVNQKIMLISGQLGPYEESTLANVEYGIESFYVPEGKGRQFEKPGVDVEIAINRRGSAVVKHVQLPEKK